MYIHVNGKNLEITDAIKAYVKEKLGKISYGNILKYWYSSI